MKSYFSKNIKYIRNQKKLSQNKFADIVKVNQSTINRWEEKKRLPTIDKALEISKILGISLDILVGVDMELQEKENK